MKKVEMELQNGMQELSAEESETIVGGESLWYWIGYGIGYVAHAISGAQTAGQNISNAALG